MVSGGGPLAPFLRRRSLRRRRPSRLPHGRPAAEGEGAGLELRLFDVTDGQELDRSHGQHAGSVRACAVGAMRTVRFEARATAGKLDAVIGERLVPSR